MNPKMQRYRLEASTLVADPGARAFEIQTSDSLLEGILLHWQGKWYAYRNACPHTGVNLNWTPDQFLDVTQQYLQCSLHGALFEPVTGLCHYGPCVGESLSPLQLEIIDGDVYVVYP